MALNRAIEGARYTGQRITWTQQDGTPQDLTGATLTGTIQDRDGTVTTISGALTVTDAENGVFTWAYSAADVGMVGRFIVQFKAAYGSLYDLTFPEKWVVEQAV